MVNAAATKAGVDIFQRPAYQALAFPKKDEYEEATMLSLQDEAEILMEWPTEFMLKYATNKIDQPFEQFMVQLLVVRLVERELLLYRELVKTSLCPFRI